MSGELRGVYWVAVRCVEALLVQCQVTPSNLGESTALLRNAAQVGVKIMGDTCGRTAIHRLGHVFNSDSLISHFLFSVVSLAATRRQCRLLGVNPSASGAAFAQVG